MEKHFVQKWEIYNQTPDALGVESPLLKEGMEVKTSVALHY